MPVLFKKKRKSDVDADFVVESGKPEKRKEPMVYSSKRKGYAKGGIVSKDIAIAYQMKRKNKASGGTVSSGDPTMNYAKGGECLDGTCGACSKCYASGGEVKKGLRGTKQAIHLDKKRGYGNQKEMGVHAASYSHGNDRGASQAGEAVRSGEYRKAERMAAAKEHHKEKLSELKSMKGPHGNYADGGVVDCPHCGNSFSHGGQVANDTGEGQNADELPNQFDYLVSNDDLNFHYTGESSGDEDSMPEIVKKAMKRKKNA